jgi:hypothetical protein
MKNFVKKGLIFIMVYLVVTLYLFVASERIERLDNDGCIEKVGVEIKLYD